MIAWILAALSAAAVEGGDISLNRQTVDSGGAMHSAGGGFEVAGTIGQPDASRMDGGDYILTGGFWFESPVGDCDADGVVTLLDYMDLALCISGPLGSIGDTGCRCFDFDADDDADLLDFAIFQKSYAR